MDRRKWREPVPIYLREVRAVGIDLDLTCALCVHSGRVALSSIKHLSGDLTMGDIARLTRCTNCNRYRCASVSPDSRPWIAHLRKTGQHDRLPFWACFVPESDDDRPT